MAEIRNCDNCGQPIDVPQHALNKRFCCEKCRNDWHNKEHREAMAAHRERKAKTALEQL